MARRTIAPPNDLKGMFAASVRSFAASQALLKTAGPPLQFISELTVLAALSLEIALKCLLLIEGKSYTGTHNLCELYRDLDPADKDRIEELWLPHQAHAQFIVDERHGLTNSEGTPPEVTIEYVLAMSANAFEDFRYLYEPGDKRGWGASPIVPCVHRVIIEKRPDWSDLSDYLPKFLQRIPLR